VDGLAVLAGCVGALERQLRGSDGGVSWGERAEGHCPLQ